MKTGFLILSGKTSSHPRSIPKHRDKFPNLAIIALCAGKSARFAHAFYEMSP